MSPGLQPKEGYSPKLFLLGSSQERREGKKYPNKDSLLTHLSCPKHLRGRGYTAFLCCPFSLPFLHHLYSQRKGRWVLCSTSPHSALMSYPSPALSKQVLQDWLAQFPNKCSLATRAALTNSSCQTAVYYESASSPRLAVSQHSSPRRSCQDRVQQACMPQAERMSHAALSCSGPCPLA